MLFCSLVNSLDNFVVVLSDVDPLTMPPTTTNSVQCGRWSGTAPHGRALFVQCNTDVPPARYVAVVGEVTGLTICELEVYAAGNVRIIAASTCCGREI